MSSNGATGKLSHLQNKKKQAARSELDNLRMLDPDNNVPLEEQYDILTEEEQKRLLEKLVVENEADIKTFSTFLKMPTVAILVMNLVFIYNYATSGLGSSAHMNGAKLPVVGVSIYSEHPVVGTELSVVILQFTFYLLSTERWDSIAKAALGIFMAAGSVHAVTCRKSGIFEFIWWLLPVLNLAIASYAQLNMRRSRQDIEKLAKKTYHVKSA